MEKTKVILDTSFLLVPYKFHIDIFSELKYILTNPQFIISKGTLNELKSLANKKGKAALEARFALKMIDKNKDHMKVLSSVKPVDNWVLSYSEKYKAVACTNDIKLKNLLKNKGVRTIMVKSKSKVDFV